MATPTNALMRVASDPLNYWGGILLDAVVAAGLLAHAILVTRRPWMLEGAILVVGLGVYTLLEYLAHRWLYHHPQSPATAGHRLHHDDPQATIALPCFVTATAEAALWATLRPVMGDAEASILVGALVIGFLGYALLHHALHHGRPSWRYFRMLRSHHRIHHERPGKNYGVTTTMWDWMFGTHYLLAKPHSPAFHRRD
ncbi:MAG TPA: sterol desaturase family protein [Candidatus Methylomirabilis sp.]|nr:sterol desaturase family protein [Candidatus Methylomirabilis sp.]